MTAISTHVLDTARGRPAAGVAVRLESLDSENTWKLLGQGVTDTNGRLGSLLPAGTVLVAGEYRLTFDTGSYFRAQNLEGFYTQVQVAFTVRDPAQHYHLPLLLGPFGYTTYRGS